MMAHLDQSTALPAVWSMWCGKSVFSPTLHSHKSNEPRWCCGSVPIWLIAASFLKFSNWTCHLKTFQFCLSSMPSLPHMSRTKIWGNTKRDIKQITSSWKRVPVSKHTPLGQAGAAAHQSKPPLPRLAGRSRKARFIVMAPASTSPLSDGTKLPPEWQISHKSTGVHESWEGPIFIWLQFFFHGFWSYNFIKQQNPERQISPIESRSEK